MQDFPRQHSILVPALKGIAIAGSLWNAGSMTTSYRLLPSIYPVVPTSRKLATKQWEFHYQALSATVPLTDLATILICSGLAYMEHRENTATWKLWASAAGLMPFGWIWVWTLMLKPSNKILEISKAPDSVANEKDAATVTDQLKGFNSLMSVRMSFPWVVGGLALWASLSQ